MATQSDRYRKAFAATTALVNHIDPIGLLEIGAPADEYDAEVADLVRMVLRPELIEEPVVNEVWVRWFSEEYDMTGTELLTTLTQGLRRLQTEFRRENRSIERLPKDVRERARVYDNGEVAWPKDHAAAAITALGDSGCLILGLDLRQDHDGGIRELPWTSTEPTELTASEISTTVEQALRDLDRAIEDDLDDYPWVLVTWTIPDGEGG